MHRRHIKKLHLTTINILLTLIKIGKEPSVDPHRTLHLGLEVSEKEFSKFKVNF